MVFLFGLFHGLGFAGAVLESIAGLGATGATVAISSFTAGVRSRASDRDRPRLRGAGLHKEMGRRVRQPRAALNRYGSAVILAFGVFYLVTVFR